MNLIDMITENEKQIIKEYVGAFGVKRKNGLATFNQKFDANKVLREWSKEKSKYLGKIFKDGLMITKKVKVEISLNEKIAKARKLQEKHSDFLNAAVNIIDSLDYESNYDKNYVHWFFSSEEAFIRPTWIFGKIIAKNCNGQKIIFEQGMKISKIFSKIVKDYPALERFGFKKFQDGLSKFYSETVVDADLVLSIHPLDYITMSDNANGWTSCMSWSDNGCYHAGTIEMMNSPYVVVGYLKSEKSNLSFGECNWNSKAWRELYIVSPSIVTSIKAYPFERKEVSKIAVEELEKLASETGIGDYEELTRWTYNGEYDRDCDGEPILDCPIPADYKGYTINLNTDGIMYNDLYHANPDIYSCFSATEEEIELTYNGIRTCMCCGENKKSSLYIDPNRSTVCGECQGYSLCHHCGKILNDDAEPIRVLRGDGFVELNICGACENYIISVSEITNRLFFKDEGYQAVLVARTTKPFEERTYINRDSFGFGDTILPISSDQKQEMFTILTTVHFIQFHRSEVEAFKKAFLVESARDLEPVDGVFQIPLDLASEKALFSFGSNRFKKDFVESADELRDFFDNEPERLVLKHTQLAWFNYKNDFSSQFDNLIKPFSDDCGLDKITKDIAHSFRIFPQLSQPAVEESSIRNIELPF